MEPSRKGKIDIKFISALDYAALNKWIGQASLIDINLFNKSIYDVVYWWMEPINNVTIEGLYEKIGTLNNFLDKKIAFERLSNTKWQSAIKKVQLDEKSFIPYHLHITDFLPELAEIRRTLSEHVESSTAPFDEKAAAWLYSIAIAPNTDADYEAAVYLKSRNLPNTTAKDIEEAWYNEVCFTLKRHEDSYGKKIPQKIIEEAANRTITLKNAVDALTWNSDVIPFRSFRDEEQDFVDAALIRTADFFDIGGYDAWWRSAITELSSGPINGFDVLESPYTLFYWCRCDLALRMANRQGLDAWVWAFHNAQGNGSKPWYHFLDTETGYITSDNIAKAASMAFCTFKINPQRLNSSLSDEALDLLAQTQLRNGSWPTWSHQNEGSLLSTVFALHALAVCKPNNWQPIALRGVEWLINQQNSYGQWTIGGGPIVLLTVLALDSISLSRGEPASFSTNQLATEANIQQSKAWQKEQARNQEVKPTFQGCSFEKLEHRREIDISIITTTNTELTTVLEFLLPIPDESAILRVRYEQGTYYIGMFGAFKAVVSKTTMGDFGPSGSTLATAASLNTWKPRAVIVIGIAFGANPKKQNIGDVLVATEIIPYEAQRVGETSVVYRAPVPTTGDTLRDRFEHALDWQFNGLDETPVQIHFGRLLSGAKLVDNINFKQKLLQDHPTAIGGEMEGAGVWAAAQRAKVEWIIVKAICDWGDGEKGDNYQKLAASSAASLCHHVLSDGDALHGL